MRHLLLLEPECAEYEHRGAHRVGTDADVGERRVQRFSGRCPDQPQQARSRHPTNVDRAEAPRLSSTLGGDSFSYLTRSSASGG